MKILIKLKRIKPRHIKAFIIQVNTIHILWMRNIEHEGDNLMLIDE
jgi:hypothetical protein